MSEAAVVDLLIRFLPSVFGKRNRHAREVRSIGRSRMDVAVFAANELIAIEAKLHNWQGAVGQALLNRYCADRSYIALWSNRVSTRVLERAEQYGVGVLAVDSRGLTVALDAPLAIPEEPIRGSLIRQLQQEPE